MADKNAFSVETGSQTSRCRWDRYGGKRCGLETLPVAVVDLEEVEHVLLARGHEEEVAAAVPAESDAHDLRGGRDHGFEHLDGLDLCW